MNRPASPSPSDTEKREQLLLKVERIAEFPLLALSFTMVPLLAASLFWDLSPRAERLVFALDALVWAIFATDLGVRTLISPNRRAFLIRHWLEILIVIIPLARPFRLLRIVIYGSRAFKGVARILNVDYIIVYAIGLVLIVATIVTTAEQDAASPLASFPNSLWWAVVTVTTVGYGDIIPSTVVGRAAGVILMVGGIGVFGAVTANLATFLVRRDQDGPAIERLTQEVEALRKEVARLNADSKR